MNGDENLDLQQRFEALDRLLVHYRQLWQFQPFHYCQSCWKQLQPALHCALQALDSEQFAALQRSTEALTEFMQPWIIDAAELEQLCTLGRLPGRTLQQNDKTRYRVNGRKWQQIVAFAERVPSHGKVLEWCAGKGHLGRLLAVNGAQVKSLEWQPALCAHGEKLARRCDVEQQFIACDVLQQDTAGFFEQQTHALALHACGDLHLRLLQQVVEQQVAGLSLAPCCYNRTRAHRYQPLSRAGQDSCLQLSRGDLALPLRQTVTAAERERATADQELVWRLAFDSWQRDLKQQEIYMPLPPLPTVLLKGSFSDFMQWACEIKSLPFGEYAGLDNYLQHGQQRLLAVRQMELVQKLFQRPLEVWLVLDRALYLQEQGYQVSLSEFCDFNQTPRNLLIQAERK